MIRQEGSSVVDHITPYLNGSSFHSLRSTESSSSPQPPSKSATADTNGTSPAQAFKDASSVGSPANRRMSFGNTEFLPRQSILEMSPPSGGLGKSASLWTDSKANDQQGTTSANGWPLSPSISPSSDSGSSINSNNKRSPTLRGWTPWAGSSDLGNVNGMVLDNDNSFNPSTASPKFSSLAMGHPRSSSFSFNSRPGLSLHQHSPLQHDALPGSHLLDAFEEEDLPGRATGEDGFKLSKGPTASALWFGPPGSRRHSYAAGDAKPFVVMAQDDSNHQQQQQPQQQQQQTQQQHQQSSPKRSSTDTKVVKAPGSVDRYFNVDVLCRNSINVHTMTSYLVHGVVPSDVNLSGLVSTTANPRLYFVQFKSRRVDVFFVADTSSLRAKVGDVVIVDADRGRDLGVVIKDGISVEDAGTFRWLRHQEQQAILQHGGHEEGVSNEIPVCVPKQILRFAQPNEVQEIMAKNEDEAKAIEMCMQKVQERGLAMSIVDAEYQWDRRKLTFFYRAEHRIDFRDLVRELFRIYKTRIWMCAVISAAAEESETKPAPATNISVAKENKQQSQHSEPRHTTQQLFANDWRKPAGMYQQQPHFTQGQGSPQVSQPEHGSGNAQYFYPAISNGYYY